MDFLQPIKGRGSADNPTGRFEKVTLTRDDEWTEEDPAPGTQVFQDTSHSIISYNDSPDLGFSASLNPYRGCEHGCIYCYARPTHEYLGFSAGLDFESKIMVKMTAPELLRDALSARRWQPQVLMMSGVTDCYQPLERRLELTRRCLEVLAECRNPVGIVTKNHLVTRDIDILKEMAKNQIASVTVSVTSLRHELAEILEPRASRPLSRIDAIRQLAEAGIPVGVNVAPVIPGLNDYEIPAILKAAREAGASSANFTMIRLPYGVKDLFESWLEKHAPHAKEKVLHRIQEVRGGRLNDPRFGSRMRGEGIYAVQIERLFKVARQKLKFPGYAYELRTDLFRRPAGPQLSLFEV
jgi:DNA repair photolyase